MLATLIPLFDSEMEVSAYSIFAQKENLFLRPGLAGNIRYDTAASIPGLEIVDNMGLDTLSVDREVFVEVNNISIFLNLDELCKAPHDKLVLLMDGSVTPEEQYINRLEQLKQDGYKLAIRKIAIDQFEPYREILLMMDYILLDHKKIYIDKAKIYFHARYPNIELCAVNVDSQEDYDKLKVDGGYDLYEGTFFRMPITKGSREIAPLKMTYIELLNVVNAPDYDLTDAADVIGHDTALVISLLEMVNHMARNSEITSIRHATAMLGQRELKKWINTAVTKELCADRPTEIMRVSMLRARFSENLAPIFDMKMKSQELFLMGLFSVLDIMLDKPMHEALDLMNVSEEIREALWQGTGEMARVLNFVKVYENADWQELSRLMVLDDIDMDPVYQAYLESLSWYRDLILGR